MLLILEIAHTISSASFLKNGLKSKLNQMLNLAKGNYDSTRCLIVNDVTFMDISYIFME